MPALRIASRDSRDAEVRTRAAKLLAKVEHDISTRPTLVTLDVRDQTVGDAIKALGQKHHFEMTGNLDELHDNLRRKITLREEKPVPLLPALDRLCAAGGMRYTLGPDYGDDEALERWKPAVCPLALERAGIPGPVSESGPFRARIHSLHYELQRTRFLERADGQGERNVDETCYLVMELIAEPRLTFAVANLPRILEAIDDQGQTVIASNAEVGNLTDPFRSGFALPNAATSYIVDLKPLRRPEAVPKRFRGVFPVLVAEFKADPIIVPLADSHGKTFDGPDATLTMQAVRLDAAKGPSIALLLRSKFEELDLPEPAADNPVGQVQPFPVPAIDPKVLVVDWSLFLESQFILVSEKGQRILGWNPQFVRKGPREALVTFRPNHNPFQFDQHPAIPAKLLFFSIMRTTAEIPFEFRDIPLP